MADFVGNDPRYTYDGRTVGLATPDDGDLDQLAALVGIQGNSNCASVPNDDVPAICQSLADRGLSPMHYGKWEGGKAVLEQAHRTVETHRLSKDLSLVWLDRETQDQIVDGLAAMALGCGVLPVCGEVLRGLLQPSVCVVAIDQTGQVVSCADPTALMSGQMTK